MAHHLHDQAQQRQQADDTEKAHADNRRRLEQHLGRKL